MYIYNNTVYSIVSIYIIIIIIIIHIDIYANNFFYLYPQNRIWSITKITISSHIYSILIFNNKCIKYIYLLRCFTDTSSPRRQHKQRFNKQRTQLGGCSLVLLI